MDTRTLDWNWRGKTIRLGADASGTGPKVLLLPALSSISSRREMHPLQQRLARDYSTLSVDWPGFGEGARPQLDWTPDAYAAFLAFLLTSVSAHPHAIIAAGHAATYVLQHAASASEPTTRLVLIAPTWRGPLPTMAGGHRPFFDRLCRLVDRPGVGPLVYRLNVNPFMVRRMGAGHVYADPAFLDEGRLRQKLAVVRAPGARFASVRFVTGRLDPLASRDAFLDLARRVAAPILVVYGAGTPPKSRAEMEALAAVPGIRTARLPRGKLAVHEEFPDATINAIAPFLAEEPAATAGSRFSA
ncbi:MAG: alpha/beta hydrolase [Hyphomicrobiales bacterium]|nr:alpha/beta hydrolase [Hyphomicrobiales bacterium]